MKSWNELTHDEHEAGVERARESLARHKATADDFRTKAEMYDTVVSDFGQVIRNHRKRQAELAGHFPSVPDID